MEWHYQEGDQSAGPVDEVQLLQMFDEGTIDGDTLVWHSGTPSWTKFSEAFPDRAKRLPPAIPSINRDENVCVECRGLFPKDDLVEIQGHAVCAECKSFVIQKLREGIVIGSEQGWRDGKLMVVVDGMELPDKCLKCGSREGLGRKTKKCYWHPGWVFLLLLLNILIALIAALITRKKVTLTYSVCAEHRKRYLLGQLFGGLGLIGGIAGVIWAGMESSAVIGVAAAVLLIAGIIFLLTWGRVFVIRKIRRERAWLHGIDPKHLESLPEWPGE